VLLCGDPRDGRETTWRRGGKAIPLRGGSGKRRGAEKAGCPKGPSSGSNTHRQRKREGEEIGGTEREGGRECEREGGRGRERGRERQRARERGGERERENGKGRREG